MQVTVGKIEELARHFRGEGGASLPPPHGIYLGREPLSQSLIPKGNGDESLRENRRAVVVVFCGIFSDALISPALLTLAVASCCSEDDQDFIFDAVVNKAFSNRSDQKQTL